MIPTTGLAALPIISLADCSEPAALAPVIGRSCAEEGFIYVSDHGISQDLIDAAFSVAKHYFENAQPEDKVDLKNNLGFTAM